MICILTPFQTTIAIMIIADCLKYTVTPEEGRGTIPQAAMETLPYS
jgi:hypothetical protein